MSRSSWRHRKKPRDYFRFRLYLVLTLLSFLACIAYTVRFLRTAEAG